MMDSSHSYSRVGHEEGSKTGMGSVCSRAWRAVKLLGVNTSPMHRHNEVSVREASFGSDSFGVR